MVLKKGGMYVADCDAKFHVLSIYVVQFVIIEEERICFFIRGLNSEFQVLFFYMTFVGKSFNEVIDYVKKVEGLG